MIEDHLEDDRDPNIEAILNAESSKEALDAAEIAARKALRGVVEDLAKWGRSARLPANQLSFIALVQEGLEAAIHGAATGDPAVVKSYLRQARAMREALRLDAAAVRADAVSRALSVTLALLFRLASGGR